MKLLIAWYYKFYYISLLEMLQFKLKTLIINMAPEGGRERERENMYGCKNHNLSTAEHLNQLCYIQAVKICETTGYNVLVRLAML